MAYAVLTVFAFVCWIKAPQLNGVVGTVVFALAALMLAREQPAVDQTDPQLEETVPQKNGKS